MYSWDYLVNQKQRYGLKSCNVMSELLIRNGSSELINNMRSQVRVIAKVILLICRDIKNKLRMQTCK